ncbi:hypothetical protein DRQ36_00370 [bacterium]|nr:MAG: hypothetical protein DRQ36_00370 [bacterium]
MLEIRESQIEDIFATQLDEVKGLLSLKDNVSLIERQKILPSGNRLDLLFLSASNLILVELKAVKSEIKFCEQIIGYRDELVELQEKGKLPRLPLISYLACPIILGPHKDFCVKNDIIPIQYSPYELLKNYYFKVKAISKLITLKPSNHGLWDLHLLNRILYSIGSGTTIEKLTKPTELSRSTVRSYLRLSSELGLTKTRPKVTLTELGKEYVDNIERDKPINYISDIQTDIIKEYITTNPFGSPAIFGIYSAVETVFALSKNFYPVPLKEAIICFRYLTGKQSEWSGKAAKDAFIMYSNYCIDLGLLAKIDRDYYITPSGIRFILLLELNKSILFVNSL